MGNQKVPSEIYTANIDVCIFLWIEAHFHYVIWSFNSTHGKKYSVGLSQISRFPSEDIRYSLLWCVFDRPKQWINFRSVLCYYDLRRISTVWKRLRYRIGIRWTNTQWKQYPMNSYFNPLCSMLTVKLSTSRGLGIRRNWSECAPAKNDYHIHILGITRSIVSFKCFIMNRKCVL